MASIESWVAFLLGALSLEVAGLWVEVVGPISAPERHPGCHYNNELYPPGEIRISECVLCECSRYSGRMTCSVDTCTTEPECIRYEKMPGICCPECVEKGCFYNNTGYPLGTKIPTPPCEVCYCPWEGGRGGEPVCEHIRCDPAPCVDAQVPPGKCCPQCPHGKCETLEGHDLPQQGFVIVSFVLAYIIA